MFLRCLFILSVFTFSATHNIFMHLIMHLQPQTFVIFLDTYDKARKKLPLAEETSCLESDAPEEGSRPKRRQKNNHNRLIGSDSEDDDENLPISKLQKSKDSTKLKKKRALPAVPVSLSLRESQPADASIDINVENEASAAGLINYIMLF